MITNAFAHFIVDFEFKLPTDHLDFEHIKKLITDAIFCGIAGSKGPYAEVVLNNYKKLGSLTQSSVIGTSEKMSVPHAALVNSYFARNYTFDDVYEPGVIHSGGPMVMSSLALGEWLNATMNEAIAAMVSGYEVAARISKAINPSHYDKGFHPTGTCNTVGVAASASKLLHLDVKKTTTALRLAADGACGFRQYQVDGDIANSAFHASKAAEHGIVAALLAKEGFADPGETVSGPFGLLNCMAGDWKEKELVDKLGSHFFFLDTSLKPYPSCRYMHGAVDAAVRCKKKHQLNAKDIKKINVYTFKMAFEEGNRMEPQTVLDAQFSIHYNIATYLLKDAMTIDDFSPRAIREQNIRDLCKKINVYEDKTMTGRYPAEWPFRVEVLTRSGQSFSFEVSHPPGSPENPLSAEEFEKKCLSLGKTAIGTEKAKELYVRLQHLESFLTVDQLVSYLNVLTGGNRF